MSAVNPLAVMDEAATYGARMPGYLAPELREARALVRALVIAARNAESELTAAHDHEADEDVAAALAELASALLPFRGV